MAKPPDCSNCQKPATIHLTQIINNQIKKLDFCEGCPHQQGVTDPAGFSLAELLAQSEQSFAQAGQGEGVGACPACGFTPADFKKTGRFGCPECYESLDDFIDPMLEKMHRGTRHNGKLPSGMVARVKLKARISQAEHALNQAVATEAYEDAAKLRDELKALQTAYDSGNYEMSDNADTTA